MHLGDPELGFDYSFSPRNLLAYKLLRLPIFNLRGFIITRLSYFNVATWSVGLIGLC